MLKPKKKKPKEITFSWKLYTARMGKSNATLKYKIKFLTHQVERNTFHIVNNGNIDSFSNKQNWDSFAEMLTLTLTITNINN